jgi:hypothetical protein
MPHALGAAAGHTHPPEAHSWPAGQVAPQAPQFAGSIWVLMQSVPQVV